MDPSICEGIDLFAEAAAAMYCDGAPLYECDHSESDTIDSDDEDAWGCSVLNLRAADARSRIVRLPDGDIHLCDHNCQFGEPGLDDNGRPTGDHVCRYTGRVVCRTCEDRTDFSTGRSTWSADPDVNSGGPMGGQWRKKRDMKKCSEHAYAASRQLDDSEMPRAIETTKSTRAPSKRGALCVDEAAPTDCGPKRMRTSKKDVGSFSTRQVLWDEASTTLHKLMGSTSIVSKNSPKGIVIDPRLLNVEVLYIAALKKYLKETLARGGVPSLDDMHDIELAVQSVVAQEKRKQAEVDAARGGKLRSRQFQADASRLAVLLWSAACKTPYLSKARRGADSFRPFCAGAYYAFKRGLTLSDGTVLVPRIDDFAKTLPTTREIAGDPASKSLHASSHRGLCTIHRCITSVDVPTARAIFADVIKLAKAL